MSAGPLNIDLVIAKSVVAQLGVVVHDLVLDLNNLWVVLEMQVSCNKAAVQFNNLRDLEFAVGGFVKTAGSLDDLFIRKQKCGFVSPQFPFVVDKRVALFLFALKLLTIKVS